MRVLRKDFLKDLALDIDQKSVETHQVQRLCDLIFKDE